jgi:hypothetical protein
MKAAARGITEPAPAREAPAVIELPAPRPRRRGGVRRKALNPRIARIELRTTPARKASIEADAKQAGQTVTAYLLSNLPGSTEPPPLVAVADPAILTRILAELGKWGSNWNQLSHDKNRTGQEPELEELRRIGEAIFDMRRAVLEALGRAY